MVLLIETQYVSWEESDGTERIHSWLFGYIVEYRYCKFINSYLYHKSKEQVTWYY